MLSFFIFYFFRLAFTAYAPELDESLNIITDALKTCNNSITIANEQVKNTNKFIFGTMDVRDIPSRNYLIGQKLNFISYVNSQIASMGNLEEFFNKLEAFVKNKSHLDKQLKTNYVLQIAKTEHDRNTVLLQLLDCKSQIFNLN